MDKQTRGGFEEQVVAQVRYVFIVLVCLNMGCINNKKYLALADENFFQGEYDSAIYFSNLALKDDDNSLPAKIIRAKSMFKLGKCQEAFYEWEQVHNSVNDAGTYLDIGDCYFKQGNLVLAKQYFYLSRSLDSGIKNVNYNIAVCLYVQDSLLQASKYVDYELSKYPSDIDAINLKADINLNSGNYEEALKDALQSLSINQNDFLPHYLAGRSLYKLKRHREALSYFHESIIGKRHVNKDLFIGRAAVYHALCFCDSAVFDLRKAILLAPMEKNTAYNLGSSFECLGNYDSADFYFDIYDSLQE